MPLPTQSGRTHKVEAKTATASLSTRILDCGGSAPMWCSEGECRVYAGCGRFRIALPVNEIHCKQAPKAPFLGREVVAMRQVRG